MNLTGEGISGLLDVHARRLTRHIQIELVDTVGIRRELHVLILGAGVDRHRLSAQHGDTVTRALVAEVGTTAPAGIGELELVGSLFFLERALGHVELVGHLDHLALIGRHPVVHLPA
mgnify:FL=1